MSPTDTLTCSICSSGCRYLYDWNDYSLFGCTGCGTETVYPPPSIGELEAFYQEMSGKKMVRSDHRLLLIRKAYDAYLASYSALTVREASRFLDLGGGVGYYARAAQDAGLECWLMDWADDALTFAREELGVRHAVQGDVQRCADVLEPETFDFILARHIIEHMLDPAEFIGHSARLLRSGGLLQIETPNAESREQFGHPAVMIENYRILRRSNPGMSALRGAWHAGTKAMSGGNPPKHLWGFTPDGLVRLVESAALEVVDVRRVPAGDPVYDPLYYDYSPLNGRRGMAIPYYFWERGSQPFFRRRGMNLIVKARRR